MHDHGLDKEGIAAAQLSSRLKGEAAQGDYLAFFQMQRVVLILETSRKKRRQISAAVLESSLTTTRLPQYIDMETEKINTAAVVREHQKGHNHSHTSPFILLQQRHIWRLADFDLLYQDIQPSRHLRNGAARYVAGGHEHRYLVDAGPVGVLQFVPRLLRLARRENSV